MALNQAQAEQLIDLMGGTLPRGLEAHSVDTWFLPALVRSRLSPSDKATFDALVTAADAVSIPAIVAGALVVAGVS